MRLSLLDQQQQQLRDGNRASSSNLTPNSQPLMLNQRPPTPSQLTNGVPASGASQPSDTPERSPRLTPSGAMAQLANSGNTIAMSVGRPSSSPSTPPKPNLPVAHTHVPRPSTSSSSGSSAFANLRERLTFGKNNDGSRSNEGGEASASGSRRHRRAESNPPPVTTVNGLPGAHGATTVFLQPPDASSSQQARSAPVSPRASSIGFPPENESMLSTVPEVSTESAKAQASVPAIRAGDSPASPFTTPAAAAVPPPAPIPVPEPVQHPPASPN
jgi:hypothetical protein